MSQTGRRSFRPSAKRKALLQKRLQEAGFKTPGGGTIPRRPAGQDPPLSFAQQRLWFLDQLHPGTAGYHLPYGLLLAGRLRLELLHRCLHEIVQRHEALRTTFALDGELPVQRIEPPDGPLALPVVDLSALPPAVQQSEVQRRQREEGLRPFDLARGPLLRAVVLRLGAEEHGVLLTLHHIVADGWSQGVLVRELTALYRAFEAGAATSPLSPLAIQYADFALWQRQAFEGEALAKELDYWRETLAGAPPVLPLPTDRPRPAKPSYRGAVRPLVVPGPVVGALEELARGEKATLFMVLLAAFATALARLAGGVMEVVIGTPVANRRQAATEDLIGLFLNTLALRVDLSGEPTFQHLTRRCQGLALDAFAHQDLPFEAVVEALEVERELHRTPVFQVMLVLQNAPAQALSLGRLRVRPLAGVGRTEKFDLTLGFEDRAAGLGGDLSYSTDLFDATTAERLARLVLRVLAAGAQNPEVPLDQLDLLASAECHQLLREWGRPQAQGSSAVDLAAEVPASVSLQQLFKEQTERSAEAIALEFGTARLSYGVLARWVEREAQTLARLGVGPEVRVAILLERSPALVVAILAVLQAGGAYVPLDPLLPPVRRQRIVQRAGVEWVVSQEDLWSEDGPTPRLCRWTEAGFAAPRNVTPAMPPRWAGPEQLAYVIFTSGSTGEPKGVAVSHGAVVGYLRWAVVCYQRGESLSWGLYGSVAFDFSLTSVFVPLLSGARLVIYGEEEGDPQQVVAEGRVEGVKLTPSHLSLLAGLGSPRVRRLLVGGENFEAALAARSAQRFAPGLEIYNEYGPTEAAVACMIHRHDRSVDGASLSVPIGVPAAGARIYLLDGRLEALPLGTPGELCIAGPGLARGYLGLPRESAEKFVPDALSGAPGGRLYRTGDRARHLPDGKMVYLGRLDAQVKIRGLRVEPGEVEALLAAHPGVAEAAVTVRQETGRPALVAFFTSPADGERPTPEALRVFLFERLPAATVPAAFLALDDMPRTLNGKVDRKALAGLSVSAAEAPRRAGEAAIPRNSQEKTLWQIWKEVLGRQDVGIHDNFFALGGDSIASIQVVTRARRAGLALTPRQLFQHQTVAQLAAHAGHLEGVAEDAGPVVGEVPLTPIQQWFFEHRWARPEHYNQALLLGLERRLARPWLEETLERLLAHHDTLRLRCRRRVDGAWRQEILPLGEPLPGLWVDLSTLPEARRSSAVEQAAAAAQSSLHLERGPLLRVVAFDLGPENTGRLLWVLHHLLVDGVSWRILLTDFETLYGALERGREPLLAPRGTSFKAWAEGLESAAQGPEIGAELAFWSQLSEGITPLAIEPWPGQPPPPQTTMLSQEETRALLEEVPRAYRSQIHEVLLAALALALTRCTQRSTVAVDLEGHGREEELLPGADLSRTVGWFTTLYPVVFDLADCEDLGAVLKKVKEVLRAIPHRGLGYGLLRYLGEPAARARLVAAPSPEVSFNYLGRLDQGLDPATMWRGAVESAGASCAPQNQLRHRLSIDGGITGGRLRLVWSPRHGAFEPSILEALGQEFLASLRGLIAHCRKPGAGGFTPSDFPLAGLGQPALDRLHERFTQDGAGVDDLYTPSPLQQGMLFHSLAEPSSGIYVEEVSALLLGALDGAALHRAFQEVVDRRAVLRAVLVWEGVDEPLLRICRRAEVPFRTLDWSALPTAAQEERLDALRQEEQRRGFDLAKPPLLRVVLIRLAARRHRVVWIHHHALLDGWSTPLLLDDLLQCYAACHAGEPPVLPPRPPYREYIAWLAAQESAAAEAFWRQTLQGVEGVERSAPSTVPGAGYAVQDLTLRPSTWSALEAMVQRHRITLATVVHGVWALLTARHQGRRQVVFGITSSGRPAEIAGVERMMGLFINTVPLCLRVDGGEAWAPWLQAFQQQLATTRQFEYLPLPKIRRLWGGVGELFDSLLVFQNYPAGAALERGVAALEVGEVKSREQTNYPLTLVVSPQAGLHLRLTCQTSHHDRAGAARRLRQFETLLSGMLEEGAAARIDALPLLPASERHQLLNEWSDTASPYPREATLIDLVHQQVKRRPEAIALAWDDAQLSYGKMFRQTLGLAHHLRARGVGPEVAVALCLARGPHAVLSLLAILAADGVYLPLDSTLPAKPLRLLLADTRASLVIHENLSPEVLPPGSTGIKASEFLDCTVPSNETLELPDRRWAARSQNLAYILYTSGSTGRPKGVAVSHGNVVRLVKNTHFADFGPGQIFLQLAPLSFDASTLELWGPLLNGGRLVMFPPHHPSLDELGTVLARQRVSTLWLTAGLFHQMVEDNPHGLRGLRQLLAGGDVLSPPHVARALRSLRGTLINGYGPTEGTTFTCTHTIDPQAGDGPPGGGAVPIGRAINNTTVCLLDGALRPVPLGAAGELCAGGDGLARGYLGAVALTAEKFVPAPGLSPGARLYRTGDLARLAPDGRLEFLGRRDLQLKIRGFRIEPGEIEAALVGHGRVAQAAVVAKQRASGGKALVAYLVWTPGPALERRALQGWLSERLPAQMIPAFFVTLSQLPLNANGKVDRGSLPDPELRGRSGEERSGGPPRSPKENTLATIWSEVLGVPQVGVDDDFFELGGDSILSIQIASRARRQGLHLSPGQLFEHPTLGALAAVTTELEATPQTAEVESGEVPLLPIQHWFFERQLPRPHHFNQSLRLSLRRAQKPAHLRRALAALLVHHGALRLRFEPTAEGWRQWIAPPEAEVPFTCLDLTGLAPKRREEALVAAASALQGSLNLSQGPLLRMACCLGGEQQQLLWVIHHLVVDGVSWRLLLEDLELACGQLEGGLEIEFAPRGTSLKRWAEVLGEQARSSALEEEKVAWLHRSRSRVQPLPRDFPTGTNLLGQARSLTLTFDQETTQDLVSSLTQAYRCGVDEVLLTALAQALAPFAGSPLLVDLEGHGREEMEGVDLARTVGWFTSLHPQLLDLPDAPFGEALKAIKEQVRGVPRRGLGYGVLRYLSPDSALRAALLALPTAEVSFNYLGQLDASVAAAGLFAPGGGSAGPECDPGAPRRHLLEVSAQVLDAKLRVRWQYGSQIHRRATVEGLAERFRTALTALIAHGSSAAAGGCTPSDFPLAGLDQAALDAVAGRGWGLEDLYPLAPLQEALLLLALAAPQAGIGCERLTCVFEGEFEPEAFRRAWLRLVARHGILRTCFLWQGLARPLQRVLRRVEPEWRQEDWRPLPAEEQQKAWESLLADDTHRGFLLSAAPLLRFALVRTADRSWRFSWSYHHLLLDGWSASRVLSELFEFYRAESGEGVAQLPAPRPFRAYIAWLEGRDLAADEEFWRRALEGLTPPPPLLADPAVGEVYGEVCRQLSADLTGRLEMFVRQHQLTLNNLLHGAWTLLLSRSTGSEEPLREVVFGVTVSGRPAELDGVESMVGMFINTLPLRLRLVPEATVVGWLQGLGHHQQELAQHQHTAMASIHRWCGISPARRLFDTLLVFENYPVQRSLAQAEGLTVGGVAARLQANAPLTLVINPGQELELRASFGRQFFGREVIEKLLEQLEEVLEALWRAPEDRLENLSLPSPAPWARRVGEAVAPRERDELESVSALEGQLLGILEATFGHAVDRDDNFFEMGGTSLLAVHLLAELRRETGIELPLGILLEAPSARRLAERLEHWGEESHPSLLVKIQPGSLWPPFFCAPPGGGSALAYAPLARTLGDEQPFYALQAQGLDGEAPPHRTIEEMTQAYLAEIRRVQPSGPYLLGGWSFGGLVAVELGRQLLAAGEEVALLAILDQSARVPSPPAAYDDAELLRDILPTDFPLDAAALRRAGSRHERLALVVETGRRQGVLRQGFTVEEASRRLRLVELHLEAAYRYRPSSYPAALTLLRAADQGVVSGADQASRDASLGWAPFAAGGLEIHQVPGNHRTMMDEPQVHQLAASLAECLRKARSTLRRS